MATQYDPIAKDESLNTTEQTPRNIADVLAEGLKGIEDALPPSYTEGDGIDITNNEISVDTTFTEASTRANIASGESFSTILGKIKKFFTDLKTVAFTGAYSDLSGAPDLTNVAYKNVNNNFSAYQTIDTKNGTSALFGNSSLVLGNNIPEGTDGNTRGLLRLYAKTSKKTDLWATEQLASDIDVFLPSKGGTIALTSDLIQSKTVTLTTNSAGRVEGATSALIGVSDAHILGAYLERGAYDTYRQATVGMYGNAGYYIDCTQTANKTPIASSSVTLTVYYIV